MFSVERETQPITMPPQDKPSYAKNKHSKLSSHLHSSSSRANVWFQIWKYSTIGLFALGFGFFMGGVFSFQNQMLASKGRAVADFDWLVLVKGDQLTIDEIGRFLKQYEGVENVSYLSPGAVFEHIRNDGIAEEDLALLETIALPPAWQISWSQQSFRLSRSIGDILWDIRQFPGVVDVAYNRDVLKSINQYQYHYLQTKLVVSVFAFLLVAASALLLGRVLFFMDVSVQSLKIAWPMFILDFICWSAGVLLCIKLLGPVSLNVLWCGLFFAALHSLVLIFQNRK